MNLNLPLGSTGVKKPLSFNLIVPAASKEQEPAWLSRGLENKNFETFKLKKKRPYYYMYNRDKSILYYSSPNLTDYNLLGLHFFTLKTHLKNSTHYLGKYSFSKNFINSAKLLNMPFSDVEAMFKKDRLNLFFNKNKKKK